MGLISKNHTWLDERGGDYEFKSKVYIYIYIYIYIYMCVCVCTKLIYN